MTNTHQMVRAAQAATRHALQTTAHIPLPLDERHLLLVASALADIATCEDGYSGTRENQVLEAAGMDGRSRGALDRLVSAGLLERSTEGTVRMPASAYGQDGD